MTFNQVNYIEEFDLVWACASLLHLSKEELPDAVQRMSNALRPKGHLYFSLKQGEKYGSTKKRGKVTFNYTEADILDCMPPELSLVSGEKLGPLGGKRVGNPWTNDTGKAGDEAVFINFIFEKNIFSKSGSERLQTTFGAEERPSEEV